MTREDLPWTGKGLKAAWQRDWEHQDMADRVSKGAGEVSDAAKGVKDSLK